MLWAATPYSVVGAMIASVEWTAFVCLHTRGPNWKEAGEAPAFVKAVMANGSTLPLIELTHDRLQNTSRGVHNGRPAWSSHCDVC